LAILPTGIYLKRVCLSLLDFTAEDLEKVPLGYQLPIKEILHHHKSMDQTSMNLQTAIFLGKSC